MARAPLHAAALVARLFALAVAPLAAAEPPATIYWDGDHLRSLRDADVERSASVEVAMGQLRDATAVALSRGPHSVVDKELTPPSGDKHDYMSYSRYWWPNPETSDGLPFVRRDGVVNRKLLARGDRNRIGMLYDDVEALALSAYLFRDERSARRATEQLRVWFLDEATRMAPHLRYGQAVPGVAEGRAPGVIDTRHFIRVIDSVALLDTLGHVTDAELNGLRTWFSDFLDWLLESELGRAEQRATNNHGAWFDAQAATIALFVGREETARELVRHTQDQRIAEMIRPDGSMPTELKRTRSLHYSLFALSAMAATARVGDHLGIDVWAYAAPSGASLKTALDYAAPYVVDSDRWPHPSIEAFKLSDRQSQLFYLASHRFDDTSYRELVSDAPKKRPDQRLTPLLFATKP